ncbi:hypothetical protein HDF16_001602 [Granulicella aggregans]|uniref:Uncharacterized protein n=1 Tax=Granulicella aggregans TaxID=474949 RepID=A0A7W7ZBT8_9BACT|nr:hypothetical protein [Granulicella aggregans]MBB5056917.1 hypothetical protein [Granulicella aggregans]
MSEHRLHLVPQAAPTFTTKPPRRGRRRQDLPDHTFFAKRSLLFLELNLRDLREVAVKSAEDVEQDWKNYKNTDDLGHITRFCGVMETWMAAAYELNARGYIAPAWPKREEHHGEYLRIHADGPAAIEELDTELLRQVGITMN